MAADASTIKTGPNGRLGSGADDHIGPPNACAVAGGSKVTGFSGAASAALDRDNMDVDGSKFTLRSLFQGSCHRHGRSPGLEGCAACSQRSSRQAAPAPDPAGTLRWLRGSGLRSRGPRGLRQIPPAPPAAPAAPPPAPPAPAAPPTEVAPPASLPPAPPAAVPPPPPGPPAPSPADPPAEVPPAPPAAEPPPAPPAAGRAPPSTKKL